MADDSESKKSSSWLKRLGFDKNNETTLEDFLEDLEELHRLDVLGIDSVEMVQAIVHSSTLTVRDIMIPRAKVVMISIDDPFQESLAKIIKSGHSRFPVLSENHEEIIGVLLSKDLLPHVGETEIDIKPLIRPVEYVPEGKFVTALINEFRSKRSHLALVVDEFGSVSGLITIEDLLEQIVGNIDDEHDIKVEDHENIKQIDEGKYHINALISLEEFNKNFGVDFEAEDVETISGMLMKIFGSLPQVNEEILVGNFQFKVLPYEGNYLDTVELVVLDP